MFLFTLLGLLALSNITAQETHKNYEQKQYTFCEIVGTARSAISEEKVHIVFGKDDQFWNNSDLLKNEKGEKIVFETMIDAMNFMSRMGWEFVQAYSIGDRYYYVSRWILRIKNDSIPND